jgi:hypothetical protein
LNGQATGLGAAGRVRDISAARWHAVVRRQRQWRCLVSGDRGQELGAARRHGDHAGSATPAPLGELARHRLPARDFGASPPLPTDRYAGTGEPSYNYAESGIRSKSGGIGILKLTPHRERSTADPTGNPWNARRRTSPAPASIASCATWPIRHAGGGDHPRSVHAQRRFTRNAN